ncbi:hypothetical protein DFP72DRAFT_876018 [Ephemerocybe angulata]|uniref:Uncharacterized protein n=1 Tax=Ephemerocybe angulata TaxID=980116 RepID=A0A8H6MFN5_9AGAR|nr:hypothetical protein DFP72DRAFT_876018 [Tulosesus angulatus]
MLLPPTIPYEHPTSDSSLAAFSSSPHAQPSINLAVRSLRLLTHTPLVSFREIDHVVWGGSTTPSPLGISSVTAAIGSLRKGWAGVYWVRVQSLNRVSWLHILGGAKAKLPIRQGEWLKGSGWARCVVLGSLVGELVGERSQGSGRGNRKLRDLDRRRRIVSVDTIAVGWISVEVVHVRGSRDGGLDRRRHIVPMNTVGVGRGSRKHAMRVSVEVVHVRGSRDGGLDRRRHILSINTVGVGQGSRKHAMRVSVEVVHRRIAGMQAKVGWKGRMWHHIVCTAGVGHEIHRRRRLHVVRPAHVREQIHMRGRHNIVLPGWVGEHIHGRGKTRVVVRGCRVRARGKIRLVRELETVTKLGASESRGWLAGDPSWRLLWTGRRRSA